MDCNKTKVCKECLSLLLTANMDGSEKLRPIVIGKAKDPRCFQKINRANLPVIYKSNAKGWMTGEIFREWLNKLDRRFREEKRHILLFIDNFSGHSPNKKEAPYTLTNIKLCYFPANCTSVVQPMDQGVINSFKCKYRTNVVRQRLEDIEYGEDQTKTITVLDAIKLIGAAWADTTDLTIKNCFRKAGFKKQLQLIATHSSSSYRARGRIR